MTPMTETVFRQLHDRQTRTLSYLIGSLDSRQAVLVDPLADNLPLYLGLLRDYGLRLCWVLETHLHADHYTAGAGLREITGARIAVSQGCGITCADRLLEDGDLVECADFRLESIATPGHTPACLTYRWQDRLLTGDALLIGGCSHTDEPGGNPGLLYDSIQRRLAPLPDETLIYPGHERERRLVSCMGEERLLNPVLNGMSRDEFVAGQHRQSPALPEGWRDCLENNRRCGEAVPVTAALVSAVV